MPAIVTQIAPWLFAGSLGYVGYVLAQMLGKRLSSSSKRIESFTGTGVAAKGPAVDFGSPAHRIRLVFSGFGLDVTGWENIAMWVGRVVLGIVLYLAMRLVVGLPDLPALMGLAGGLILMSGMADGAWNKFRAELETELPSFLNGFSSTIQVTPDVLQAIEEECKALDQRGPLRQWMVKFVEDAQSGGYDILDKKLAEAHAISSSLAVVLFLIGRLWRVGGVEWGRSFQLSASNLEGVLDARIMARASGDSAKNSVKIVIAMTVFMTTNLVRNPQLADAIQSPVVQVGYAIIMAIMFVGWNVINDMIDNAV